MRPKTEQSNSRVRRSCRRRTHVRFLHRGRGIVVLTARQSTKLRNMHHCRRRAIQRRMLAGMSFSAAEGASQHVFDTVGWHEVVSRLARARGIVFGITEVFADGRIQSRDAEFAVTVRELVTQIACEAAGLQSCLPAIAPTRPKMFVPKPKSTGRRPYAMRRRISETFALGQLRAARKFVGKCRRDASSIEPRGGAAITQEQYVAILGNIRALHPPPPIPDMECE